MFEHSFFDICDDIYSYPNSNYDNWWEHEDGIYGNQLIREDQCIIRGFELPEEGVFGLDVVDGCFLATNREVKFDENLKYDGFLSAYEHDICMHFKSKKLDIGVIKHMTWHVCSVQGKIREKYIFEDYRGQGLSKKILEVKIAQPNL